MGFVFLAQVDKLVLVTNNAEVVHKDSLPRIRSRLHSRSFIIIFDNTSEAVKSKPERQQRKLKMMRGVLS